MCGTWAVMGFTLPEWLYDLMSTSGYPFVKTFTNPLESDLTHRNPSLE
jgi:hypothetical protein